MGGRRRVIRRYAGRAFLRFFIGELLLFIVCALAFLFLTKWSASVAPAATATPSPTAVQTPIPSPSPSPLPSALFSAKVTGVEMPEPGDSLVMGMQGEEFINNETQTALKLSAYAFIKGEDAAGSTTYAVVSADGVTDVYNTARSDKPSDLTYGPEYGSNLDQIGFTATIDMSSYPDGDYQLGLLVVNGASAEFRLFDPEYAFVLRGGVISGAGGA